MPIAYDEHESGDTAFQCFSIFNFSDGEFIGTD